MHWYLPACEPALLIGFELSYTCYELFAYCFGLISVSYQA